MGADVGSGLVRAVAGFPPGGAGEQLALPVLAGVKTAFSIQCDRCLPSAKHLFSQPPPKISPARREGVALATLVLHGPARQREPACFRRLTGSCAASEAVLRSLSPAPVARAVPRCLGPCHGAGARVLPFALSPGCAGWLPLTGCQGQRGTPCPKHFTAEPPSSLAALTVPLRKPSLAFLLSRVKDFTFTSPGCPSCGSLYFWPARICPVLAGEARQENDSLLYYVTLMIASKSMK